MNRDRGSATQSRKKRGVIHLHETKSGRCARWMAGAVNTIGQSKRGGGDRSSRPAQLEARENEQKALSLWIKGATYQQIAAAGFGIATPSGAWRAVHRALARIPKQEADQAREGQLARLQAVRMLLWNHAGADPIKAAEVLIKLEARAGRLLGVDMTA